MRHWCDWCILPVQPRPCDIATRPASAATGRAERIIFPPSFCCITSCRLLVPQGCFMMSASSLLLTAFSQTCSVPPTTGTPAPITRPRLLAAKSPVTPCTRSTIGHLHLLRGFHLISGSFLPAHLGRTWRVIDGDGVSQNHYGHN